MEEAETSRHLNPNHSFISVLSGRPEEDEDAENLLEDIRMSDDLNATKREFPEMKYSEEPKEENHEQNAEERGGAVQQHEEMILECFREGNIRYTFMTRANLSSYIKEALRTANALDPSKFKHRKNWERVELPLHSHDLRRLNQSMSEDSSPFILVRRHVILLKFPPVYAIILRDRCILLLPHGADAYLGRITNRLHGPSEAVDESKFEFRALEAILEATLFEMQHLSHEYKELNKASARAVVAMKGLKRTNMVSLDAMRKVKNEIDELRSHATTTLKVLTELLDNDDDLFLMNLTRLWEEPALWDIAEADIPSVIDEIEILLESVVMTLNQMLREITLLQQRILNSEKLTTLRLDGARNTLTNLNLILATCTAVFALAALPPGYFGMNLLSNVEEADNWFRGVVLIDTLGAVFVIVVVMAIFFWQGVVVF